MKIVAEMWFNLGDLGDHEVTVAGSVREDEALVSSATVSVPGGPEIDLLPLFQDAGLHQELEEALLDGMQAVRESAAEASDKVREHEWD